MKYLMFVLLILPIFCFGQTKIDTVSVDVLYIGDDISVQKRSKERVFALVWVAVPPAEQELPSGATQINMIHMTRQEWVLSSERWLSDVSNCYELKPLEK